LNAPNIGGRRRIANEPRIASKTRPAEYSPSRALAASPWSDGAALLHLPFFDPDPDADDAINNGAVGATIGLEMSHAFNNIGSQYDADGRLLGKPGELPLIRPSASGAASACA
jgi:hypothetical protein